MTLGRAAPLNISNVRFLASSICTTMDNSTEYTSLMIRTYFTQIVTVITSHLPLNCTIGCGVLILNLLVIYCYHKKYKKFVPCMYLLNASLDSLMIIYTVVLIPVFAYLLNERLMT